MTWKVHLVSCPLKDLLASERKIQRCERNWKCCYQTGKLLYKVPCYDTTASRLKIIMWHVRASTPYHCEKIGSAIQQLLLHVCTFCCLTAPVQFSVLPQWSSAKPKLVFLFFRREFLHSLGWKSSSWDAIRKKVGCKWIWNSHQSFIF